MRITRTGVSVAVEEYGAEGVVELSELDWLVVQERQKAFGRPLSPYEGIQISMFDRVVVKVEANQEDGRHRSLKFSFVELPVSSSKPDIAFEEGKGAKVQEKKQEAA